MKFFGKIREALGFSEDELEREMIDDLKNASSPRIVEEKPAIDPATEAVPQEIFDTVVRVFNDSMPDFLAKSLNPEAQKQYLYEALDESMKQYLARLATDARQQTETKWESERVEIKREMERIRSHSQRMEEANAEQKEQKLSAERQKRALSEKVHELEKQIANFDAEREQYELENKSLLNKLRAASTVQTDTEALNREIESLRAQIASLKAAPAPDAPEDAVTKEEHENLLKQNEALQNDVATLKKRCEIADAMINDLNFKASSAQQALAEREKQLAEENDKTADENKILRAENEEMRVSLLRLTEQMKSMNSEIEEARESAKMVEATVDKFEQVKAAKDSKISSLNQEIDSLKAEIQGRDTRINQLKTIITENQRQHDEAEKALREEIENIQKREHPRRRKSAPSPEPSPEAASTNKNPALPPNAPVIAGIDDTEWLISPSEISDDEAKYENEPDKKNDLPTDDFGQMLLW